MSLSGAFAQCEQDKDCPEDMPGCKDGTCVQCTSSKHHCKEQVASVRCLWHMIKWRGGTRGTCISKKDFYLTIK